MESEAANERITFAILQSRLIKAVNRRIQNGDFTERGLARILGISQPQIHNVLKGARKLRPELADRLISSLEMTMADLFNAAELRDQLALREAESNDWASEPKHWRTDAAPKKPPRGQKQFPGDQEQVG